MMTRCLFYIYAGLLVLAGCSVDHGIAPLPGRLEVDVSFRGEAPPNTQGIYLIVAPQFPPHAINELYQVPNSLPIDQERISTGIDLPYGHYEAFALWWYSTDTKSNLADMLAMPLDYTNFYLPMGFDITREQPVVKKSLIADWNGVNRDAAIRGTITFNGPFPDNTLAVAIAAFKYKPEAPVHFLIYLKSIDFSIDENPYDFMLPVRRGGTGYIAVYWLPEDAALMDFKQIGLYRDPEMPENPGKVTLSSGETRSGINIEADWNKIED
jgi:hypothetical protein